MIGANVLPLNSICQCLNCERTAHKLVKSSCTCTIGWLFNWEMDVEVIISACENITFADEGKSKTNISKPPLPHNGNI